jgi:hypothetical protein
MGGGTGNRGLRREMVNNFARDDYDVIGTDGLVLGQIFKATTSPAEIPWM